MAVDEALAQRVRERLAPEPGITEKRMFGGLAFLLNGNMAVGVHGDELIVRIDPDGTAAALAKPGVRPFDMSGRPMRGWILVNSSVLAEDTVFASWIAAGCAFAETLPPK
ncbi:hypothetical protein ABIA33_003238 [Streptacidiphilus sp. MAP12-16]|uniref:TfoX/Sxy family protein n=1 Tax=Streptacidiphilus sp. MAP12-16 TaxID=3156300 RepID=UPI003518AA58